MRKLIAGNWKMNGTLESAAVIDEMIAGIGEGSDKAACLICPPFPLIAAFAARCSGTGLTIGAQDCHMNTSGAHTGDVASQMLADVGATHVIVGHSERRADHGESSEIVASKVEAALSAGLVPIICVGEQLAEREAGQTMDVVLSQLARSLPDSLTGKSFVVAYEPVWAIGTGLTASADQIGDVHLAIRTALADRFGEQGANTQILYGGSMKPANAAEILGVANVDGGLIGGASLKAEDFLAIYRATL